MKIKELFEADDNDDQNMPHLYLDMDGVQADFFGHWAKTHGVASYKDIPNAEESMQELANSTPEQVYDFFRKLTPLTGGMRIVMWLKEHSIPYTVLSAPLRGPYSTSSVQAKKDWLDEYNPGTSDSAIFTSKKFNYATDKGIANVLVDDFGRYLDSWSAAGGIAVKHDDAHTAHTINELEKIYKPYLQNI